MNRKPKTLELHAREITPCRSCGGPLTGPKAGMSAMFHRVRVDVFLPHAQNLQQRGAMEMYFGSGGGDPRQVAGIADVFSPSVVAIGPDVGETYLVCQPCAMSKPLAFLLEAINDRDQSTKEEP